MKTTPEMDLAVGRAVRQCMQDLMSGMLGDRAAIQVLRLGQYQRAEAEMILRIKQELSMCGDAETSAH